MDADGAFDERRWMRTAKSCGPDASTLASSSRKQVFAGDGDKKARSPGRARRKPLKPLRREGRTASAEPVCSCALFCTILHARPRVQRAPGFPCALCSKRAKGKTQTPGETRRGIAKVCPAVIASAAKQSMAQQTRKLDCFAALAMTVLKYAPRLFDIRISNRSSMDSTLRTSSAVVARLDRAIQYSRDGRDRTERPRRTGYPRARV